MPSGRRARLGATADFHHGLLDRISEQRGRFHETFHSIQTSFNRRFTGGVQFGVNHTYTISEAGNAGLQWCVGRCRSHTGRTGSPRSPVSFLHPSTASRVLHWPLGA